MNPNLAWALLGVRWGVETLRQCPDSEMRGPWGKLVGAGGAPDSGGLALLPQVAPAAGNLVQFGVMIERMTGKSALQYNDYGCYCGIGGSHWPVDATDW